MVNSQVVYGFQDWSTSETILYADRKDKTQLTEILVGDGFQLQPKPYLYAILTRLRAILSNRQGEIISSYDIMMACREVGYIVKKEHDISIGWHYVLASNLHRCWKAGLVRKYRRGFCIKRTDSGGALMKFGTSYYIWG